MECFPSFGLVLRLRSHSLGLVLISSLSLLLEVVLSLLLLGGVLFPPLLLLRLQPDVHQQILSAQGSTCTSHCRVELILRLHSKGSEWSVLSSP